MLTGAVDVGKGLFVQQAGQAVLFCHGAHGLHDDLVVVAGDVGGGVFWSQFVLRRGSLVVLGLAGDAHLPKVLVQVLHKGSDTQADAAAVVVVHLLAFGRARAKEGAAADLQVQALLIKFAVDEEVFLLGANHRHHPADVLLAQQVQQAHALVAHGLHGAQQRGLGVQGLAGVGAEGGGDKEGTIPDEGRAGGVPGGVAPSLKGGAQAAGGEAGGVRLAADQRLAGKFHGDLAVPVGGEESVVLSGSELIHRLEPVGIVGRALVDGPVHHGVGHDICDPRVQGLAQAAGPFQAFVHPLRQPGAHGVVVKNAYAKDLLDIHALSSQVKSLFHSVCWLFAPGAAPVGSWIYL